VLLSFIAHAVLVEAGGGPVLQILVSGAGIAIMIAAATLMTWSTGIEGQKARSAERLRAAQPIPVSG
jgi:hypothetical protein